MPFDTKTKANPMINALTDSAPMQNDMGAGAIPSAAPAGAFDTELTAVEDAVTAIRDGDPTNLTAELDALDAAVAALRQKAQPATGA